MPSDKEIQFLDHPEVQQYFQNDLKILIKESDRGAVFIDASILEEQLKKLFEAIATGKLSKKDLKRILKYPGPLSTFSARLDVAFLNRLIDEKLYNSILSYKKIRNAVAHEPNSFLLKNYQNELFEIYNLGVGVPNFLREKSGKIILKNFIEKLSEAEIDFGDETRKIFNSYEEVLNAIQESPEAMSAFEEKLYRLELGFGIGIICGLIIFYREKTSEVLGESKLISSLGN